LSHVPVCLRTVLIQVYTEPPPSAVNMTLPAFAAELRRLQHDACPQQALSRKPACNRSCCRSTGHTDGLTPNRCIDPAPHTMRAASTRHLVPRYCSVSSGTSSHRAGGRGDGGGGAVACDWLLGSDHKSPITGYSTHRY